MSELNEKLLEIKRQKDTYILPENIKKDITVYGVTGTLDVDGILKFYDETEMKEYTGAEDNQIAAIIDMSDWWDTESNTFYDTIISVPDNNLRIDPFDGNTNFHSITNFYDENDTVIGTFDATYNKLVADLTLEVESISYRYIIWWERVEQREEWAVGGSWNRTKYVRIENGEEVDVEDDYISLTTAIKYNWYSGDEGAYDITSSFIEKPIAKYLEFYIYKWGNWERVGKQGFPMLFKNLWLWENYRDNLDINTMQGEEIAVVFDNEYTKMLEQEVLVGASFPYWINIDAPFSDNPNDTFTYEGRDEQNNLCSTVTISSTDVTINITNLEDYDEGTRSYRITYEYDSENDAFIRQEFKHIKDGEEFDDDSPDDNVWFWKDITWTLTSQVEPDYYIVGQFVQLPSTPVYIDTYEFIYDDNPHWISLSQPRDVVKRFYTVEQMQEDPNSQEGDLSVVYREEIQPVTEESKFDSCIFPNEVVLDEAFTDNIYGSFRAVDSSSSYFNGNVEISPSRFIFDGYGDQMIRIQYTSSNGITYTRTDGGEELQEFGTVIKWEDSYEDFNNVIGNFMKIGGNYFEGLYQYGNYLDSNYNNSFINVNSINKDDNYFIADIGKIKKELAKARFVRPYVVLQKSSNTIHNIPFFEMVEAYELADSNNWTGTSRSHPSGVVVAKDLSKNKFTIFYVEASNSNQVPDIQSIKIGHYINNNLVEETKNVTYYGKSTYVAGYKFYFYKIADITDVIYVDDVYFSGSLDFNVWQYYSATDEINGPQLLGRLKFKKGINYLTYFPAKSQLDTTADYVYEKTFYGKNGVETGTLGTPDNSFADINAEVVYEIQQRYENMQPRVLTDQDKIINENIYFIPTKSDGTPLLDTSNVTDMSSMFNSCASLTSIPLLDTSNVINMSSLFANCSSLTSIPQLNTINVTDMSNMFKYCPNLSNESLNNILAMCTNAIKITSNKTLKYIGLTNEQATTCQGLSNYNAFVSAGWTAGY